MNQLAILLIVGLMGASSASPIEPRCADKDPTFCKSLSEMGLCNKDATIQFDKPVLVIEYCPKTCGFCGGDPNPNPNPNPNPSGTISRPGCGKRPLAANSRVIAGTNAIEGDWAWSVSITRNGQHFCGGILIAERYILSAAHCFQMPSSMVSALRVDIGMTKKNMKEHYVKNVGVASFKNHEQYNANQMTNDIAIIRLASDVQFDGKYIIPACVPGENGQQFDYQGKVGTVTGWGDTKYQSGRGSDHKLQGNQDILSDSKCEDKYKQFRLSRVGQVCAGEVTQYGGACQGDSGGPFSVLHTDGLWYAYGIVSFGLDCGYGTVYTRVSNYVNWIKTNMF